MCFLCIIQKILKDGIDIDKLLVVTFTNAAASEMRERVLEAIYKKLDEEPENENLQKQIILLGKSNICTIHSFCLDVIKNNFQGAEIEVDDISNGRNDLFAFYSNHLFSSPMNILFGVGRQEYGDIAKNMY